MSGHGGDGPTARPARIQAQAGNRRKRIVGGVEAQQGHPHIAHVV
jgi:hypothetical protein